MNKIDLVPQMDGQPLEVKDPSEVVEENEEKETPSEAPTEEKPADDSEGDAEKKPEEETPKEESEGEIPEETPEVSDDAEKEKEIKGLKAEEEKLTSQVRENIVNLRSQRREQRQSVAPSPLPQPTGEEETDPEVQKVIDQRVQKILKDGGYVPKSEIDRENTLKGMRNTDDKFYKSYPEYVYSPDLRNELDNILDSFKEPATAEEYEKQVELAHNLIKQRHPDRFPVSAADSSVQKRLETASRGTGGKSKPSSSQGSSLTAEEVAELRRGGWSEEDIRELEKTNRQINKER